MRSEADIGKGDLLPEVGRWIGQMLAIFLSHGPLSQRLNLLSSESETSILREYTNRALTQLTKFRVISLHINTPILRSQISIKQRR